MAISPMYFPVLSPQQANPMLYGMGQGSAIAGQNLQNATIQQQLPYAGPMAQAQLGIQQAQAPYINSQTAMNNAMLPYAGYRAMGPYMGAYARMQQAAISNANSYRQLAATPAGQAMMKNNLQFRQAYYQAMQNSSQFISSGFPMIGGGAPMAATGNYGPSQAPTQQTMPYSAPSSVPQAGGGPQSASPAVSVSQGGAAPGAVNQGGAAPPAINQANGAIGAPYSKLPLSTQEVQNLKNILSGSYTPQQDAQVQQINANQIAKQNYTQDQQKRIAAGERFKVTSQQMLQDFDNGAGQYFTSTGQAQLKTDESVAATTKKVSPALQAYRNFLQDSNTANLQGAILESVPADQIARGDFKEMFEPAKWTNSPGGARAQLVNAINLGLKADMANKLTIGQTSSQKDTLYSTGPAPAQQMAPTASRVLNGTTYHKINGKWYSQ